MKQRRIQYIVKYNKYEDKSPQLNEVVTIDMIKRVSANYGAISEVAGEFAIVSDYNWTPILMARRISYDKNG